MYVDTHSGETFSLIHHSQTHIGTHTGNKPAATMFNCIDINHSIMLKSENKGTCFI
jgi:hypothetical protein